MRVLSGQTEVEIKEDDDDIEEHELEVNIEGTEDETVEKTIEDELEQEEKIC